LAISADFASLGFRREEEEKEQKEWSVWQWVVGYTS
jgi:hypothetical protein